MIRRRFADDGDVALVTSLVAKSDGVRRTQVEAVGGTVVECTVLLVVTATWMPCLRIWPSEELATSHARYIRYTRYTRYRSLRRVTLGWPPRRWGRCSLPPRVMACCVSAWTC